MIIHFTQSNLQISRLTKFCLVLLIATVLFACDTEEDKKDPPPVKPPKVEVPEELPERTAEETEVVTTDTNEEDEDDEIEDLIKVVPPGQNPVLCGGKHLAPMMMALAKEHTGVPYLSNDRTTQCSGIFQRVLNSVRRDCPEAVGKTPPANQVDSRGQGKWYYKKKALTLIKDPIAQAELIRPGAVMFYGKLSQDFYNTNPVEKLWDKETGIRHVGVVVDVERNEDGEIESYSLFHGRTSGTTSGISNADNYMHRREAKSNAPSFGNGPDPWVGVAAMVLQE